MKEIVLLRHAKSDWNAAFGHDHERPLNERGTRAAALVGRFIAQSQNLPDQVFCSTAVRAQSTLQIAMEAGEWTGVPVELLQEFYGAGPSTLIAACQSLSSDVGRVLLVGHEPGWSQTVGVLVGDADVRMATATLACVAFDADTWKHVGAGQGTLKYLLPPRLLEAWPHPPSQPGTS